MPLSLHCRLHTLHILNRHSQVYYLLHLQTVAKLPSHRGHSALFCCLPCWSGQLQDHKVVYGRHQLCTYWEQFDRPVPKCSLTSSPPARHKTQCRSLLSAPPSHRHGTPSPNQDRVSKSRGHSPLGSIDALHGLPLPWPFMASFAQVSLPLLPPHSSTHLCTSADQTFPSLRMAPYIYIWRLTRLTLITKAVHCWYPHLAAQSVQSEHFVSTWLCHHPAQKPRCLSIRSLLN